MFRCFSPLIIVIIVTLKNTGDVRAVTFKDDTSSIRHGHVYGRNMDSGAIHRLHRREIETIGEAKHVLVYLDDGSPPLDMELSKRSVLVPESVIIVRSGDNQRQVPNIVDEDCLLHGRVLSRDGVVSINTCGKMTGSITLQDQSYDLEELSMAPNESTREISHPRFKITKKNEENVVLVEETDSEEKYNISEVASLDPGHIIKPITSNEIREPKAEDVKKTEVKKVTIEVAVYADSYMMERLSSIGINTRKEAVEWFRNKWNKIQDVYSDVEKVGFDVKIELKRIELWLDNPHGYPAKSAQVRTRLTWFRKNTPEDKGNVADLKVLYTYQTGGHQLGQAYIGKICHPYLKAILVKSPSENIFVELHEMGHNLGLLHDPSIGNCESPGGFMGWEKTYRFLDCYRRKLLTRIGKYKCLYREDSTFKATRVTEPTPADTI